MDETEIQCVLCGCSKKRVFGAVSATGELNTSNCIWEAGRSFAMQLEMGCCESAGVYSVLCVEGTAGATWAEHRK